MSEYLGIGVLVAGITALGYWGSQTHAIRIEDSIREASSVAAVSAVHPLTTRVTGRDIRISGYVDDDAARRRILDVLDKVEGRRVVVDGLIVLPRVAPFNLRITKGAGGFVAEGYAPSAQARARLADAIEIDAGELPLASGAPLGWTDTVLTGVEALAVLNGGVLDVEDARLALRGTAESPDDRMRAEALLAGVPDGATVSADIDVSDDGTLPFEVTYDAGEGLALGGRLPKGMGADRIVAFLGGLAATVDTEQSAVANPELEGVLIRLKGWLPEMDRMELKNGENGLSLVVELLPGTDEPLIAEALGDLDIHSLTLGMSGRDVPEGARRTNAATGLEEIFVAGYWLPDLRFEATIATCDKQAGDVLGANRINFLTGSARLGPKSMRAINAMAAVIRTCTQKAGLRALLGGHTDNTGDDGRNMLLSLERAEAVRDELVARGVPRTALSAEGYGASRPIADNEIEAGRAANRRTTIEWSQ